MNPLNIINMLQCYEIGKRAIDEAMFIYKLNNKITPDFRVCKCSVQMALAEIKERMESGKHPGFVQIRFIDLMQCTSIYVNTNHLILKNNQ